MPKYNLTLNISPFTNLIIDLDGEVNKDEINNKIMLALEVIETKELIAAKLKDLKAKEPLLTRLYLLMDTKEYDAAKFFQFAEITFATDLESKPNDFLIELCEMLEAKANKKPAYIRTCDGCKQIDVDLRTHVCTL